MAITIETKKVTDLSQVTSIEGNNLFVFHDGAGLKSTTFTNLKAKIVEDPNNPFVAENAGAHNAVYRGASLGTSVTTEQYQAISSGKFTDLFIGDYWTIGGKVYRIAAFDYYLGTGDDGHENTKHHVVLVPDKPMYDAAMNASNTTSGGYIGSQMYKSGLTQADSTLSTAFGEHLLSMRNYLCNAVQDGIERGGAWVDVKACLMHEMQLYGNKIFAPVSNGTIAPMSYPIDNSQFPLFAHDHSKISTGDNVWLRNVVSDTSFSRHNNLGFAGFNSASASSGVRPFFCIG